MACPYLDAVEVFSAPAGDWRPAYWTALRRASLFHNRRRLFARSFDLVLLPRRNPDYRDGEFLAFSSGFSCVVALSDHAAPANRDGRYRRSFAEIRFPVDRPLHDADYALTLLERLGGTVIDRSLAAWSRPQDEADATAFLSAHLDPTRPFAVLHPSGGNSRLKQWPVASFASAAHVLAAEFGLQWLVIGGSEETWIFDRFPASTTPRISPVPGRLPLPTLTAVLRRSRLFVGGDSGPMHLANAAATPVVAIFGPTCQSRFAPRGPNVRVVSLRYPCSPDVTGTLLDRCQSCPYPQPRCLHELTTDAVVSAARSLLAP